MTHATHLSGPGVLIVAVAAVAIAAIAAMLVWKLRQPVTNAERVAVDTEAAVTVMMGSVLIVYSHDIRSEHMLAVAARVARRERAELLVAYVIEVPLAMPLDAEMPAERDEALGTFAVAESIARKNNVDVRTEIVRARQVATGALELARKTDAHLIIVGAYREGTYTGAPLGRAIELIAAQAPCDVLIGVRGPTTSLLKNQQQPHERQATPTDSREARSRD